MASSLSEARRRGFMDDLYRTEVPDEPQEVKEWDKLGKFRKKIAKKKKPRLPGKTKVGPEVSDKPKIKRKKESLGYT